MKLKPWMVAVALAVAGAVGGSAVYVAATRVHEADRAALVAFEDRVLPHLARARTIVRQTPAAMERARRAEPVGDVEAWRRDIERAAQAFPEPPAEILQAVSSAYGDALAAAWHAVDALATVRARGLGSLSDADLHGFEASSALATKRFDRADRMLVRLRCRARLERCETLPEP